MSDYGKALAIGVVACKYELIARMDSDDISDKTRCEEQLKIFNIEKNMDIVGTASKEFEGNIANIIDYRTMPKENSEIYEFAKRRCPFIHSSVMFRKSKVLQAGNYQDFKFCEDYELWTRMLRNNASCYNLNAPLVFTRLDEQYYKRRGGIKYLKHILNFKKLQYKNKFFSLTDYIVSSSASIFVCMLPNQLRKLIYKKGLRTSKNGK